MRRAAYIYSTCPSMSYILYLPCTLALSFRSAFILRFLYFSAFHISIYTLYATTICNLLFCRTQAAPYTRLRLALHSVSARAFHSTTAALLCLCGALTYLPAFAGGMTPRLFCCWRTFCHLPLLRYLPAAITSRSGIASKTRWRCATALALSINSTPSRSVTFTFRR